MERRDAALERAGGEREAEHRENDDAGVAEREPEARRQRPLAALHQLARDVVDRRDVVGIDGVAQPETVGQERRAEQHRPVGERDQRRAPRRDIPRRERGVERDEFFPVAVHHARSPASSTRARAQSAAICAFSASRPPKRCSGRRCSMKATRSALP